LRTSTSRQDLYHLEALANCDSASKYISKSGHLIISLFVLFEVLDERASVLKWIWLILNERPPKFTKQSAVLTLERPASCRISCFTHPEYQFGLPYSSSETENFGILKPCWQDSSSESFPAVNSHESSCVKTTKSVVLRWTTEAVLVGPAPWFRGWAKSRGLRNDT
jgi:hypothetical protein